MICWCIEAEDKKDNVGVENNRCLSHCWAFDRGIRSNNTFMRKKNKQEIYENLPIIFNINTNSLLCVMNGYISAFVLSFCLILRAQVFLRIIGRRIFESTMILSFKLQKQEDPGLSRFTLAYQVSHHSWTAMVNLSYPIPLQYGRLNRIPKHTGVTYNNSYANLGGTYFMYLIQLHLTVNLTIRRPLSSTHLPCNRYLYSMFTI